MTNISHPIRPARAAIAAVLALTATPLLAQEIPAQAPVMPDPLPMQQASPTVAPPAAAQQPQIATPQASEVATPPAASLPGEPVPMAMPVAPNGANGVPVTSIAPPAIVGVPEAPAPRATRAPVRTATPPAAIEPTPVPAEVTPEPVGSIAEPVAAVPVVPMAAAPAPAPAEPVATGSGDSNGEIWGWMAALLAALGIGGGAIALGRTRTRKSAAAQIDSRKSGAPAPVGRNTMAGPHDRPVVDELVVAKPVLATAPARFDQPVMQTPAPQATAVEPSRMRRASAPARTSTGGHGIDQRQLEQMIAQRPSRDNPFVTRANRKRRALFLLRNRYPLQTAA